jgi:chromosome partitioning protein
MVKKYMIISIVGQKGGTGKSTLACNIASILSKEGKTLLIDTDNQCTTTQWFNVRYKKVKGNKVKILQSTEKLNTVKKLYDFIIVDVAGKDSKELRKIINSSDVLLIPVRPSLVDINTLPLLSTLITKGKNTFIVLNAFRYTKELQYIDYIKKYYKDFTSSEDFIIKQNVAYVYALNSGLGIDELKTSTSRLATKQLNNVIKLIGINK